MNRTFLLILSSCLAMSIPLEASPISQLVVFGDSLSDNGNVAIALGGALPGNYAPNAFTDGPATVPATGAPLGLWVDQLATRLGVADPHPFLAGGTNYAVGSALTGHNPAFSLPPSLTAVPYTSDQVALYLSGHVASSSALYAFWAGAEDIFAAVDPTAAANNVATNIQTLAAAGATNFLWLNLPPLGDTPDGMASGHAVVLNAASLAYDTQWAADIALLSTLGIHVTGVNVDQLFSQIMSDPALFGFTNVSDPAWCGPGGLAACAANNPNRFLFWDGRHPTTAAGADIADLAYADVVATPEPDSLSLCLVGMCCMLAAAKCARGLNAARN
jgi:phospholipase/lecithinase/hemolysin